MVRDIGSEGSVTDGYFGVEDDGEGRWVGCLCDLSDTAPDEGIGAPGMGD